ncbi:MAG: type II secretion system F family protein [Vicinamibacteria bacterium]|nr:type II secretion system F family protein [Vicinamibacteria bacterium]
MAPILIAFGVFVFAAGLVVALGYGATQLPTLLAQRRVGARMADVARHLTPEPGLGFDLVKRQKDGALPAIDRAVAETSAGTWVAKLIEQAGSKAGVSTVLLASLALGAAMAFTASALLRDAIGLVPGFLLGASVPFVMLMRKRTVRVRRFEEQFPEALDLLSRALKAGHAFQTAMGMVAEEGAEPMGSEFRKTFEEQNYGLPLKDALNNLAIRMPLLDVRFFATAVLIQRETGGNLSEILDNLAYVVRERFKILRQVRVYTAHGRMTGYVLLALPAFLAVALMFINPEHMDILFHERVGRMMIAATVVLQTIGYLWIRKVVTIEV